MFKLLRFSIQWSKVPIDHHNLISTPVSFLIPDTFVTSHEFTLARDVPDLRLGIVGSLASGKSALVHRFMTGAFLQEESPEGGRFKKEVLIDGHSHLLLIRDEGVPPELQVREFHA